MEYEIRVITSVSEIDQEDWEGLGKGRPFSSYAWYRFGEKVLSQSPRRYILLYQAGKLVGRATFWLSPQEPLPLPYPFLRPAVSAFLRRRPLFICRSPLAESSGLILPDTGGPGDAHSAICSAARDAARELHASFVVFDYLGPGELAEDWQVKGFFPIDISDPGTSLVLPGTNFEEYIHRLSKNAQKDYRRHMNQARAREIQVTTHPTLSDSARALALIRGVEAHHQSMPKPWTRNLLDQAGGANASWMEARQKGALVGCGLILRDGPVHMATLLGLDYSVEYVYFQLMYAAIQSAMQSGAQTLRAGSGAYAFKKHLGFDLEGNNHLVYAGCSPLFQRIGGWLGRASSNQVERSAQIPANG